MVIEKKLYTLIIIKFEPIVPESNVHKKYIVTY